jgi:hypothetical protein
MFINIVNLFYRNSRGNRGYQVPPRHLEENRLNKFSNNTANNQQYGSYGGINSQKTKPPRFQRNQENQNLNQQYNNYLETIVNYNKFPQMNEFKNTMPAIVPFTESRQETISHDFSAKTFKQNQPDYVTKASFYSKFLLYNFSLHNLRLNFYD